MTSGSPADVWTRWFPLERPSQRQRTQLLSLASDLGAASDCFVRGGLDARNPDFDVAFARSRARALEFVPAERPSRRSSSCGAGTRSFGARRKPLVSVPDPAGMLFVLVAL